MTIKETRLEAAGSTDLVTTLGALMAAPGRVPLSTGSDAVPADPPGAVPANAPGAVPATSAYPAGPARQARRKPALISGTRSPEARLAQSVLDQLPLAVAVLDAGLRLLYWNAHAAHLLGVPPLLAQDTPLLADLLAASAGLTPQHGNRLATFCAQRIAGAEAELDSSLRLAAGRGRHLLVQMHKMGAGRWMLVIDDHKSQAAAARATSDAWLDALTGLNNRRQFDEALRAAVAGPASDPEHALLMIDLDRFKPINDTLGYHIGDALLCLVAQRLRREIRDDDLLARLGGDEFVMLARASAAPEVLAARVVDVLCRPFLVEGHIVNIGASVGIARFAGSGISANDLMRHADLALYDAKTAGGRTWRPFQANMAAAAKARRTLETDLRKALALDEFFLMFQPQLNVRAGIITGFEALLRWNHPQRGLIPPSEFIPIAEDIGCIEPLGAWVLKTACEEAVKWPAPLTVAVNVSARQLEDSGRLFRAVEHALQMSGLPAARLEVEITESALLARDSHVLETLHRLRAHGVRIAMDDFGTGYSSLSQLQSFPFTKIKIDQAFIANLGKDASAAAVVRAITALGTGLGMTTTAEGVETAEQAAMVEGDGCTDIQGYLISRPVNAADIDSLLERYAPGAKPHKSRSESP